MLRATAVLMFESGNRHLVPAEPTSLHPCEGWGRGVPPFWNEDDEGQWLTGVFEKVLEENRWMVGRGGERSTVMLSNVLSECPAVV